ncbi:MAG: protease inhibitor I42 family protein [Patescibacteria group bacterium]
MNKKIYILFVIAVIVILGLMFFPNKNVDTKSNELNQQNDISNAKNLQNIQRKNYVEIKNRRNFEIPLKSNPTTGYSWVAKFDENYIELINKNFVQQNSDKQIVGAGSTEVFQFKALKTGETKINFYYLREWEIDIVPIDQKVFDVIIK